MKIKEILKYIAIPVSLPIAAMVILIYIPLEKYIPRLSLTLKTNMKRIFKIIANWLRLQRIRFQMRPAKLKKAIKQADRLHKETGKRYRVFFFGNKYHVWNRQDIREKQHGGLLKWKKVGEDFDRICFYDTNPGQATSKSLKRKGGTL